MKKTSFITSLILLIVNTSFTRSETDSLVSLSDLRYQSAFEKEALFNFVQHRKDTFNLFLAIDEHMTTVEANRLHNAYLQLFDELNEKKINSKKIDKKIKIADKSIHDHFLKEYNSNEYYPVLFESGIYNCVSASMLFSLVFDQLKVPYKVMASSEHVYLIADPGQDSVVIETINPSFEKTLFTQEFKKQYVYYLHSSKLISESDFKNRSVEELFEEKYNQVKEAEFYNLPGFQYYNKAIFKLMNNEKEEAYQLCQKAYYFNPDQQVKTLLYISLLLQIEQCHFDKVSDIDYLVQLLRFENAELSIVVGIFNNIIARYLQSIDKEEYCDSLYRRLISQISDKTSLEEISFSYFLQMSYKYQKADKVEQYVANALKIKGDHHDANVIMENYIHRKLDSINDSYALLDTVLLLKKKYDYEHILPVLEEYQMIAYLRIASDLYDRKNIRSGEKYLQEFESICTPPVKNQLIGFWIERTYRSYAVYYFYKNDKVKAKSLIDQGLKYIPDSDYLRSAVY